MHCAQAQLIEQHGFGWLVGVHVHHKSRRSDTASMLNSLHKMSMYMTLLMNVWIRWP